MMRKIAIYGFGIIPALISWAHFALFVIVYLITGMNFDYFRRVALSFDQLANALLDGDEDETPSSRMGRRLAKGEKGCCKWRYYLCKVLSTLDPTTENHCIDAIGE